mmetsp:Transcript_8812/g.18858  ORF Transcript_8812/g.18858 Transcript_8812/m.18858 type:complete len:220 (-) Transcript_8812:3137-3796(-)
MRFSSRRPCAVPIRVTPLSAMVRQAMASASVPISSTITTSGMWFSTASIMTRCCLSAFGTCMRRAFPMAGCGTSPSPPISLDVSMMTTRFFSSTDSTRATSRMTVVLPTPGLPSISTEWLLSTRSRIMSMCPSTALPTRHVSPMMCPLRFRMALIRCSVPAMPARLSAPNTPTACSADLRSSAVTSPCRRYSPPGEPWNLASGGRPRSITTSNSWALLG